MGSLIVIEGLDGSGKATQTKHLSQRLAAGGRAVRVLSFPNYKSGASTPIKMYLNGDFGKRPQDVNAYAASAFYAVDRYASFKQDWQADYNGPGLILADRYTTSNAIHQCAKLPQNRWAEYIDWLEDFEYVRMGIPKPDLVICLDVPPPLSQALMEQRYKDEGKKDIHEQDMEYLTRCHEAAHWCAGRLGWKMVGCAPGGSMRDIDDIAEELEQIVIQEDV